MKNEREINILPTSEDGSKKSAELSFETIMKNRSKEIVIKDFVPRLKTKPSDEKIDRATGVLNKFRMRLFSGNLPDIEQSLRIDHQINSILTEPTKLDASKRKRSSKKNPPNKAA